MFKITSVVELTLGGNANTPIQRLKWDTYDPETRSKCSYMYMYSYTITSMCLVILKSVQADLNSSYVGALSFEKFSAKPQFSLDRGDYGGVIGPCIQRREVITHFHFHYAPKNLVCIPITKKSVH